MIIRMKVFVSQEEFDYFQELFVACHILGRTDLKYCFLDFFVRFLQNCLAFFDSEKISLEGYFKYLFFIPGPSKIT